LVDLDTKKRFNDMGKSKIPKKYRIAILLLSVPFLAYYYYTRIYLPEDSIPIDEINAEILFDNGVYTVINNDDFEWKWLTISVFVPSVLERGYYTQQYSLSKGDSIVLDDNELSKFSILRSRGARVKLKKDTEIKSYRISGRFIIDGTTFRIKKINWENETYKIDN